jgi:hypothetical protein
MSPWRRRLVAIAAVAALGACRFDRAERWLPVGQGAACTPGESRCSGDVIQTCVSAGAGATWETADDCGAKHLSCNGAPPACLACPPGGLACDGQNATKCRADGSGVDVIETCDTSKGFACRSGACSNLCVDAVASQSNVGCEYWGVDLDNAMIDPTLNAAAQQYAIVVSNPQADVPVHVTVTQDDSKPGDDSAPLVVATGTVLPRSLTVFKLGPREVDGSPDGEFNTGTHTALTRHAYRVTSDFPVVAFQFNPLDNVNVFSNDASLLKPATSLGPISDELQPAYVAIGWPQTIASTDNPDTNFNPSDPIDLRAFLTIVGTRPHTKVRVTTTVRVVGGGPVKETKPGGVIEATLEPFDVLNLETGGFNADFTGSLVETTGPVVVFSGSEASDSPRFDKLADRFCCADHLEQQLDPIRTAGTRFVAPREPSHTAAVAAAGASLASVEEVDYFRVVSVLDQPTMVTTTLPAPNDHFVLAKRGDDRVLSSKTHFMVTSSAPVQLANVSPSQDATGVPRGLPGGDPSLLIIPPIEQWRADYVFLTPDKYVFDFITVIALPTTKVSLDGDLLSEKICSVLAADGLSDGQRGSSTPPYVVYRCQLSFPVIDPSTTPVTIKDGSQNDGVHRITTDGATVGLLVSGFDSYVSYSYAGGTQLRDLTIQ